MNCRLLYLIGQLRPGGSERQLYYLLERMDRERYWPEVVIWNYEKDVPYVAKIQALDIPLHAMPDSASRWVKLASLRQLVRQRQPEVLHSYSSYTNFVAWLATRGTRTMAIGAIRGDFQREAQSMGVWLGKCNVRWPRAQIFNNVTAITVARQTRRFFMPKQLFLVPNGIDLQRFCRKPLLRQPRACIVGVGTLLAVKRWDRLLRAAYTLRQQGYHFLIQIVGDGPLRSALCQEAARLGIMDCIALLGYREDVPALLAGATFVVHTAESEGSPNAIMEAMACGRAVVAMDVGDIASVVEDGTTGFVVPPGDEKQFVQRMATLLANPDLCQRMGEAGSRKAAREFDLTRLVAETLAAYRASGWQDASGCTPQDAMENNV